MHTGCKGCKDCGQNLLCRCLKVTEELVVDAIRSLGARTLKDIQRLTGAGSGCMCCQKRLRRLIEQYLPQPVEAAVAARVALPMEATPAFA